MLERHPDGRPKKWKGHVAWIPQQFAVKGKIIGLKKKDGSWDEGWEVTSEGGSPFTESQVDAMYNYWKAFRDFTYAGRSSMKTKKRKR